VLSDVPISFAPFLQDLYKILCQASVVQIKYTLCISLVIKQAIDGSPRCFPYCTWPIAKHEKGQRKHNIQVWALVSGRLQEYSNVPKPLL
jgi:hypothetical protein